jgi:peptidoglycan-N-acetylglucosamine deacetylase
MRVVAYFRPGVFALLSVIAVLILSALSIQHGARDVRPVVAKSDHHLWPEPIDRIAGFDKASRASLLIFVSALRDTESSDADSRAPHKIAILDRGSVKKYLSRERAQLLLNYQLASRGCIGSDWTCAPNVETYEDLVYKSQTLSSTVSKELQPWWKNMKSFSRAYFAEQLRLASLFPMISSEIDRFSDNEWNGDVLPDRQFFLTFDDGPSAVLGTTDEVLGMLEAERKSALFFVIGSDFQKRRNETGSASIAKLYRNKCIASHGWEHRSHATWEQWQESVERTQALLRATIPASDVLPLFRPPFGERKADSGAFFQAQSLQVALWNIDSQDWNNQVNFEDIVDRMTTLM